MRVAGYTDARTDMVMGVVMSKNDDAAVNGGWFGVVGGESQDVAGVRACGLALRWNADTRGYFQGEPITSQGLAQLSGQYQQCLTGALSSGAPPRVDTDALSTMPGQLLNA